MLDERIFYEVNLIHVLLLTLSEKGNCKVITKSSSVFQIIYTAMEKAFSGGKLPLLNIMVVNTSGILAIVENSGGSFSGGSYRLLAVFQHRC